VLGVHASQVKVVAVYQGSVIIDFFITVFEDLEEEPEAKRKDYLAEKKKKFLESVAEEIIDLGAPILNALADNEVAVLENENQSSA